MCLSELNPDEHGMSEPIEMKSKSTAAKEIVVETWFIRKGIPTRSVLSLRVHAARTGFVHAAQMPLEHAVAVCLEPQDQGLAERILALQPSMAAPL
jgi:hypothetical protein